MFKKLKAHAGGFHSFILFLVVLSILAAAVILVMGFADDEPSLLMMSVILLGVAILICFEYIIAGYFYFAAVDKGYCDLFYLILVFFFPLVGQLLVIALPDRGIREHSESKTKFSAGASAKKNLEASANTQTTNIAILDKQFFCPKCKKIIPYSNETCPNCGQFFDWSKM